MAIKKFKKGERIKAKILAIDVEKERISLGIKQLGNDPLANTGEVKKGLVVTCTVIAVTEGGLEVSVGEEGAKGFIRKGDLARDRADQFIGPSNMASNILWLLASAGVAYLGIDWIFGSHPKTIAVGVPDAYPRE